MQLLWLVEGAYAFISAYQKDTTPPVLSAEKAEVTASIEATDEELKNGVVAVDKKDGNVSGSVMIDHIKRKKMEAVILILLM